MRALLQLTNTWARVDGVDPQVAAALDAVTSYATPNAAPSSSGWVSPDAQAGEDVWDGWVHLSRFPNPGTVMVPAGLRANLEWVLRNHGVVYDFRDLRECPEPGVPDREAIPLYPFQKNAVEAFLSSGRGVIVAPPRAGKTRIGLEAQRCISRPTLWVAPTSQIVRQTCRAAEEFFGRNYAVPCAGVAQAEEAGRGAPIVVTTAATASELSDEFYARIAMLVLDEIHHAAAKTWRVINLKAHRTYHRLGLSGTFFRSNGDDLAMQSVLSDVIFRITADELLRLGRIVPTHVAFIPVGGFRIRSHAGKTFQVGAGRDGIFDCEYRNQLAAWALGVLTQRGCSALGLVGTKPQGRCIEELVAAGIGRSQVEFVSTDRTKRAIDEALSAFQARRVRCLLGTSMIGEGTDLPVSDAMVYAPGGKAEVGHTQAAYRVATASPGKRYSVIVDFADRHHDTLMRHSEERLATYLQQPTFQTTVLQDPSHLPAWLDSLG